MTYLEGEAEVHPLDHVLAYYKGEPLLDLYLTELPQYEQQYVSRFTLYWPYVDRIDILLRPDR